MQKNKSKRFVKKDSTHKSSSEKLLQILQRILDGIGGTISYVFLEERSGKLYLIVSHLDLLKSIQMEENTLENL